MWSFLQAEWIKTTGNRWLVGCLFGVFPLVALGASLIILVLVLSDQEIRQRVAENPTPWTEASLFFWAIPNSIIGRLVVITFSAVLFGGEYQWGTWKTLLPGQSRVRLILAKFLTLGIFVIVTFAGTSLIWMLGRGLIQWVAGGNYPPAIDTVPNDYWQKLSLHVTVAFVSVLILAAIAALVALLTRSILASAALALAAALLDGFVGAALLAIYLVSGIRFFPGLYRFSVTYNVDNLLNYANGGGSVSVMGNIRIQDNPVLGNLTIDPPLSGNSLPVSLLILLGWLIFLIGLATYTFDQKDVVS